MSRERSPARDEAKKLYLNSKGKIKLVDIAANLNIKDSQVRKWKSQDKWEDELKGALPKPNSNATNESVTLKYEVSWLNIENEYVTDIRKKPSSLENLSKKYNIPIQTVKDYSASHEWSIKRTEYKQDINRQVKEKSADIISTDIAKYQAKHLNISDKILNEISKALDNPNELYTVVEKLRQGYGQGEFTEKITTETLDVINDSKVANLVNSIDRLQKMQRQTLGIMDEKDNLKHKLDIDKFEFEKNKDDLDEDIEYIIEDDTDEEKEN